MHRHDDELEPLAHRAAPFVGPVLERRDPPLPTETWSGFASWLSPAATVLLTVYWPEHDPDEYHLDLLGAVSLHQNPVARWLIQHHWLLVALGPDGTYVACSNGDDLKVAFISMQESVLQMEEYAAPLPHTVCETDLDVFDLLEALDWMARESPDGVFPDDLEMPIPLDFYGARKWMNQRPRQTD